MAFQFQFFKFASVVDVPDAFNRAPVGFKFNSAPVAVCLANGLIRSRLIYGQAQPYIVIDVVSSCFNSSSTEEVVQTVWLDCKRTATDTKPTQSSQQLKLWMSRCMAKSLSNKIIEKYSYAFIKDDNKGRH